MNSDNYFMKREHAIVIGAGAAGCLAARILSDHFLFVTIIEKDSGPSSLERVRQGLPQGMHVHNVLYRGNQILDSLYPSLFSSAFDDAKAPMIEVARDQRLLGPY